MKHFPKKIFGSVLAITVLAGAAALLYFGKLAPLTAVAEEKTTETGANGESSKLMDNPDVSSLLNKMSMQVAPEQPILPDFELLNLDGEVVRLSDFKGQTVLLGFFTTW